MDTSETREDIVLKQFQRKLPLWGVFALLFVIVAVAVGRYRALERAAIDEWSTETAGLATYLVRALDQWHSVHVNSARRAGGLSSYYPELFAGGATDDARARLEQGLQAVQQWYDYRGVWVLDRQGQLVAATSASAPDDVHRALAQTAATRKQVSFGALRVVAGDSVYELAAPVILGDESSGGELTDDRILGAAVVRLHPTGDLLRTLDFPGPTEGGQFRIDFDTTDSRPDGLVVAADTVGFRAELPAGWTLVRAAPRARFTRMAARQMAGEAIAALLIAVVAGLGVMYWRRTERLRQVEQLAESERKLKESETLAAVGRVVSGVAHELNNPLATILHASEELAASAGDESTVQTIAEHARRARMIVRSLQTYVGSTATAKTTSANLLHCCERAIDAAEKENPARGCNISLACPRDLNATIAASELEQIVTHLVSNAIQASPPGGRIRVSCSSLDARTLEVTVVDEGEGLTGVVAERLFEPFFTTKPPGQGLGLGLAVSQSVARRAHGEITGTNAVDANGRVLGAFFTLRIGKAATAEPAPTDSVGNEIPAALSLLIVDDEASLRMLLTRAFTRRGYTVRSVDGGSAAIAALSDPTYQPDVILSDLKMPDVPGYALYAWLRTHRADLAHRILFYSGDTAAVEVADFIANNPVTVLAKPLGLDELYREVAAFAANATSADQPSRS